MTDAAARHALLLDYGGGLTGPVHRAFARFERHLGIPPGRTYEVLVAASRTEGGGAIGALERGEIGVVDGGRQCPFVRALFRAAGCGRLILEQSRHPTLP